ncbi:TPR-like protein [Ascobolus immersus RN42]|uniref:TPR-like protein n=1 Tax=Ascobolus immersus RN42 TaxID=1160509 RepID=A0A3N4HXH0_ASCIM|nr:TPR-like protein [Ascobolus immersus RN42]
MSLFGGAECSTGANPLAQMSKVLSKDKQTQQDRLTQRPGELRQGGLRTGGPEMAQADRELANQFFDPQAMQPGQMDPFALDQMRRELDMLQQQGPAPQFKEQMPMQPMGQDGAMWAADFGPQAAQQLPGQAPQQTFTGPPLSAAEFAMFNAAGATVQRAPGPQQHFRPTGYALTGGMMNMVPQHRHSHRHAHPHQQQYQAPPAAQAHVEGKGKEKELDAATWDKEFAEAEAETKTEEQINMEKIEQELNEQLNPEELQSIWNGINEEASALDDPTGLLDDSWIPEFDSSKPWQAEDSHTLSMPRMGEYLFEPENPYLEMADPFSEGKRLLESGGNLSLAALAFEAAVQKDSTHLDAWVLLGRSQAQNEKETPAIRALETALKLDDSHQQALMDLAVSYTNEGYDTTAYTTLERWLLTKYPSLSASAKPATPIDRQAVHDRVVDLFLKAAQLSPDQIDSDVQVGLGVLFYGAEEYDKAVDCFSVALQMDYDARDKNHLLWNRLGATLANSGRPEEAINAYEKALEINPNFVRARYNLGVSCINIGCFAEAAQHLLGALAMHKVAEDQARTEALGVGIEPGKILQNESTNLTDTLRRVFNQMGRNDLAGRVGPGMDLEGFRGEFDF